MFRKYMGIFCETILSFKNWSLNLFSKNKDQKEENMIAKGIRTHHGVHHSKEAMKHEEKKSHLKNPRSKIGKVMEEYKEGTLHSGKSDKPVSNKKQAVAIALSEAKKAGAHIKKPKK